uniref:Uncharacterized protein n=1 Tax=mine drainage metagenome TaxID=410659 RepID=E6PC01_9ZZZZ
MSWLFALEASRTSSNEIRPPFEVRVDGPPGYKGRLSEDYCCHSVAAQPEGLCAPGVKRRRRTLGA